MVAPILKLSVIPFALSGSTPYTFASGKIDLIAEPTPLIKPPPPTDINTLSIFIFKFLQLIYNF